MQIYDMCRIFKALPYSGGVLNQPKYAINRLLAIGEANDRWQEEQSRNLDDKK